MVGGVDAGRVVDRVGVDAAALERIFDAAALGHAEIGALADDARGDLLAVDAQRVVRAVSGIGGALMAGLDIGADAAEPQEIDRGAQHGAYQLGRRHLVGGKAEGRLDLRRHGDRFDTAVEDAAALRDQRHVVIVPR